MIRIRTLIAAALLAIPVLTLSAEAPTGNASRGSGHEAATSAPPGCYLINGQWHCF
jgi:hypothetical protein